MSQFNFYTVDPPVQWRAGYTGEGENKKEFFFNCADCGVKEPQIAGIISTDGTFNGIGMLKGDGVFVKPALFCEACFKKRLERERT